MTTIVLKLAAVGYSAAAFPCKAFRMKPRQRRVAAGAAQTSPYPDRPLTALRRRPYPPSFSLPTVVGLVSSYIHLLYARYPYRAPVPVSSSFARCPATVVAPRHELHSTSLCAELIHGHPRDSHILITNGREPFSPVSLFLKLTVRSTTPRRKALGLTPSMFAPGIKNATTTRSTIVTIET